MHQQLEPNAHVMLTAKQNNHFNRVLVNTNLLAGNWNNLWKFSTA